MKGDREKRERFSWIEEWRGWGEAWRV